jgi:heme/copper-type cytochrome/quinol oxidase subunit 2
MRRVAGSLWRDLLVPWAISAACVCVFMALIFAVGLIAWPICCCIFLFFCVQRSSADNQPPPGEKVHGTEI